MKLRQLFENIYEQNGDEFDGSLKVIGVCFGRFNPPHRGHKAVWQAAAANPIWYVGTNQSTSGPKDPLPYDVKLQAMAAVWPKVAGHVIPEQSLLTLAAKIYEEHGANVHLKVYTDEDWLVKTLSQYNGVEKEHGMYKFQQIDHVRTERLASATNLRAAVRNGDRASFYKDMGIKPSVTINVGDKEYPVFDVVAHYLNKYPEKAKKAVVAESSTGVSVRGWANQVRKDHGTDIKFVNRKEGGGAVDMVRAINSQGETVGVYNRKTGYPTVFEPKQELEEYGDTAKGQKMLTKVQKRAVDRVTSKKADTDPKYAKKNADTADRAWERMSDKDLEEGEVVQFPKKHKSDLDSFDDCPKCGRDLMGGTYMGHKVKVCNPCKQVYLPPNSGIDQKGNKIVDEIAGAFPSPSTKAKWAADAAASNAAEAKRQELLKAQQLQKNTAEVDRLQKVNHHSLDGQAVAPAPTNESSQYWAESYFAERAAALEEASGYIPKNKKEAKDPRWSTALTQDVTIGAIGKNLRAFKLAEQIAEMERDLIESSQKKITKRVQQATAGLNTYGDSEHVSGDYTGYRLGLAVAGADGKNPIDMKAKSWIGKKKSTHPYTKEEQDMLKQAYKAVGATYHDMNNGDMKSKELDSTNKTSPVAKPKKNKYGV